MLSKAKLLEYAKRSGIDLVAVAPADRFAHGMPEPQFNPLTIFPEAKSVIMCAREIPRGAFRGIEEGTLWTRQGRYIQATHMYALARFLEDEGGIAVPSSPLARERWPEGVKFKDGAVEPNVYPDLEYGVVACGLGEIGYCGLVITKQFGVRQALGMITTDLEIECDPVFSEKICAREDCAACVGECPMKAFEGSVPVEQEICGVKFTTLPPNKLKCRYCPNGMFPDTTGGSLPNRLSAACGRACIAHLEEKGLTEKHPITPFRRRERWGFDLEEL